MSWSCKCLLCRPVPGKRVHPVYGYDLDQVGAQPCVECGKSIMGAAYVEELGMARFGSMQFRHAACETEKDKRSRLRMEKQWHKRQLERERERGADR
jgi:hypothetical protein